MAMKLNAKEKANDSALRAYNAQIEKAFKTLGANHTTTRNLVAKAKSIFGSSMRTAHTRAGDIPQIQRNRKTVSNDNAVKALQKETRYKKGTTKAGQFLPMFDATRAYQKAIKNVRQNILKSMPARQRISKTAKELSREISRMVTSSLISEQITENDLASEVFEKYKQAKEQKLDIKVFQDFAKAFHDDGQKEALNLLAKRREEELVKKALDDPALMEGITDTQLRSYLSDFEDLNPF